MQATYDSIVPKYQKTRSRTIGEEAFGVAQTNKQIDTQSDNKGRLELSGRANQQTDTTDRTVPYDGQHGRSNSSSNSYRYRSGDGLVEPATGLLV